MQRICLHDKTTIEAALRHNPLLHLYELGDLDDLFWPFTTWYAAVEGGRIADVALVYSAGDPPILLALSADPAAAEPFIRSLLPLLPPRLYAHLSGALADVVRAAYDVEAHGLHRKMALVEPARLDEVDTAGVVALTAADLPELEQLYARSYPDNAFDPRTLATGMYRGLRRDGRLVGAAGIHVYSERYGVATVGNVVTLPELRGQGIGTATCAALGQALRDRVPLIGLNVKADNEHAVRAYRRLGFAPVADYQEVMLTLREA